MANEKAAKLTVEETERGSRRFNFTDLDENECSIETSSLAYPAAIRFGVNNQRMHINQKTAAALLPLLQSFAETGWLPNNENDINAENPE